MDGKPLTLPPQIDVRIYEPEARDGLARHTGDEHLPITGHSVVRGFRNGMPFKPYVWRQNGWTKEDELVRQQLNMAYEEDQP